MVEGDAACPFALNRPIAGGAKCLSPKDFFRAHSKTGLLFTKNRTDDKQSYQPYKNRLNSIWLLSLMAK